MFFLVIFIIFSNILAKFRNNTTFIFKLFRGIHFSFLYHYDVDMAALMFG